MASDKKTVVTAVVFVLAALALAVAIWAAWKNWPPMQHADSGSLNISWFVFRDTNRNGIYDMGDRPYAGFPIRLKRSYAKDVEHHSNINGFANFKMSRNPRRGVIHEAGKHEFIALVPDNWEITSGSVTETLQFVERAGSPAGLTAERTLKPLGIAPLPRIEGQLPDWGGAPSLEAIDPDGKAHDVPVREAGAFRLSGRPGTWQLVLKSDKSDRRVTRKVEIGYHTRVLPRSFFDAGAPVAQSDSLLVDYDDLIRTKTVYEIPNGYRGLQWHNWLVTHNLFYEGSGYVNATVSSEFAAYNSSGHPATISREEPFDFVGSYVGVAWPQARQGNVHVKGFRDGELKYHTQLRIGPDSPVYLDANYRNITELRVHADNYWQVILDDSRFRLP